MQVIIAGTGKLAAELLQSMKVAPSAKIASWANKSNAATKSIVVHAGSGRELEAIASYCESTQSTLIELATGSKLESMPVAFPVVLCPNTNILMLKFMAMLEQCGKMFNGYEINIVESHQASKASVPGTAVNIAHSLGMSGSDIQSVRDTSIQRTQLEIPEADIERHAFHQIMIHEGKCSVKLETRVYGEAPYAEGVAQIVAAACGHKLESRLYSVMEFVKNGWL
jgi:4-hydroxy-tetrahydrodipicolinate reductase